MAHSSSSYLQTLAKDEAIAFVASLQKVKTHLGSELQWMSEQVQQKTMQLQGIEAILSEAEAMGLVDTNAATPKITVPNSEASASLTVAPDKSTVAAPTKIEPAATETFTDRETLAPTTKSPQEDKKPKESDAKAPIAKKTVSTKGKKPGPVAKSSSAGRKGATTGLQQFLQADFQTKSITDSVNEILAESKEPLSTDDIMTELYHSLSSEDYQRAKSSLSNMLSLGKTKGRWRNTGRGMYASNN